MLHPLVIATRLIFFLQNYKTFVTQTNLKLYNVIMNEHSITLPWFIL